MKLNDKLTLLVVPINNAVGHANACAGATRPLLARGHRVIFCVDPPFRGRFREQGFDEIIFESDEEFVNSGKPGEGTAQGLAETGVFKKMHFLDRFKCTMSQVTASKYIEMVMHTNGLLRKIIDRVQPDAFVVDNIYLLPCIYYSDKPWIKISSLMPLWGQDHPDLPPSCMGLPYDDKSDYEKYKKIWKSTLHTNSFFNDHVEKAGYPRFPNDEAIPQTQCLTVYAYPDELNYPEIRACEWFNLEMFNHSRWESSKTLDQLIPKTFFDETLNGRFSGKYVYLSMGTLGSVDVNLLKRLVAILSGTPHKYIVSKGPRHGEFELAENMWGGQYLHQVALLPHMDLVITHGGNNTTTEAFSHGKPMVVFPLFAEQPDNAQRIQETGFGVRLEPYDFEDHQLVEAVDKLLKDDVLKRRLQAASQRLHKVDHSEKLADKIESMFLGKSHRVGQPRHD